MEDRRYVRRAKNDPAGSGTLQRPQAHPTGEPSRQRAPLPTSVNGLPALPPAYHAAIEAGLAGLGIELAHDQRTRIDDHVRLLLAWNAAINLSAIREPAEIAVRHVMDSLTAVPLLRARGVDRLLDLGSGGGFPGLPLAAAVPLRRALLVESVGKKAAFLRAAIGATAEPGRWDVEVAAVRAEALAIRGRERGSWQAVSARAVGSLADLVELAFPLLAPGGCLVAWKRGDLDAELAGARRAMSALGGGLLDLLPVDLPGLLGHCLVVATRTGTVPAAYPRDTRVRKREPI